MIGGITTDTENSYKSAFYQYNLTIQEWKNITNPSNLFTFRSHAKGALIGSDFYIFFGLEANSMKELATCYKISLEDPEFKWNLIPILGDNNDLIRRSSYGLGVLHEKVYLFGGTRDLEQKNSLIIFDMSKNPIEYQYFNEYNNPGSRMCHSLNVVGGHLLLFGGDRKGEKLNDFWKLDLKTLAWKFLSPRGEVPSGRSHHAAASNGDILIIWGGYSVEGYLNDAYIYNILTNIWYKVDYSSESVPSPRTGACMGIGYSMVLIYGGITYNGLSDELWYLDLDTKSYTQLQSANDGPGPIYLAGCKCPSDRTHRLFVHSGIGPNEIPSNGIYIFNKSYMNWTKLYHDQDNLQYARGYTKIFKVNFKYVYFGGEGINSPDDSCYYWNQTSNGFYKFGVLPKYIFAAAQECFGTSIYMHGGGAAMGENFRWTVPVSNFLYVDLISACVGNDPCTWAWCSSGTYLSNNVCEICPSGTYQPYYGGTCLKCPKGTYYPGIGATSIDQCYPCNDGTYNPYKGASFCLNCPAGVTCPAGSSD
ncbi:unnamed protein product [Blepharisma stoltei]|uniref:Tyrosine-protein kinase ephrin type A/B receptor-like domain-containing protein n=1 Tax=Blepharisma stoltei TaxID=1481888 RepID=A0AAU9IWQ0_9CILI|nr:unnamed protein product [Blepharisma stoltei]